MTEEPSLLVLYAEAVHRWLGPVLGKWVVLEVDGARVEGVVTSAGTDEPTAADDPGTPRWYLEVDGVRVHVPVETIAEVAAHDPGSGSAQLDVQQG